jgi:hypothetical protein
MGAAVRKFRLAVVCLLVSSAACARYEATQALLALGLSPEVGFASVSSAAPRVVARGVLGRGLALSLSSGETLNIDRDGVYAFAAVIPAGETRSLTILRAPSAPDQTCTLSASIVTNDAAATPAEINCTDDISPLVSGAAALSQNRLRVFFSRGMQTASALNPGRYRLSETEVACSGNLNYSSAAATPDAAIIAAEAPEEIGAGSVSVIDLELSAPLVPGKRYYLYADRDQLTDLANPPNALACPNGASVEWGGAPRLLEARCAANGSAVRLTFSAPMLRASAAPHPDRSATCSDPVECARRYRVMGPVPAGDVLSVLPLDGVNCDGAPADASGLRFCLEHALPQTGGVYAVLAANQANGDGFDNAGCGWTTCSLAAASGSGGIGAPPEDRVAFTGCGAAPASPDAGPINLNPYGDGSYFGYLVSFANRIFTGPGASGNLAAYFYADGSSPGIASFQFQRDQIGLVQHANPGPFFSIGFPGCTPGQANAALNCGPHNEDGRGLFASGTLGGAPILFLTGSRPTAGNNDYIYYARELNAQLRFSYVDLSAVLNTTNPGPNDSNRGVESILTFNDRTYVMMPGDNINRPYLIRLNNLNAESTAGTDSEYMYINLAPGIGQSFLNPPAHPRPAYGDRLGGLLAEFRNRIYVASSGSVRNGASYVNCLINSGYPTCENDGGLVRSESATPAPCTGPGVCADWADTTPSSVSFRRNFSIIMPASANLHPHQRPFPAYAEFNGAFYLARNACTTNMSNFACREGTFLCSDDAVTCANPVPQLWKCRPESVGDANECDPDDWSLVAGGGPLNDVTNFGDVNNREITLLAVQAGRLYAGFDNVATGVELWRTRPGVTDPTGPLDFEQSGADGFGFPATRRRFYSSATISAGATQYLYMSVGDAGAPLGIFVQRD